VANRSVLWIEAVMLVILATTPSARGQQSEMSVTTPALASQPQQVTGLHTDRLSPKQLRMWKSIQNIVFAIDSSGQPLHPKLHSLVHWAEISGYAIYIEMPRLKGLSPYTSGIFKLESQDCQGRSHKGVIHLYLPVIDQASTAKWIRWDDGLIPFEGSRGKARRYAEVLGHELTHAVGALTDPNYARQVEELEREVAQLQIGRRSINGQSLDRETRQRLEKIKTLVQKTESRANLAEVQVWQELVKGQQAKSSIKM